MPFTASMNHVSDYLRHLELERHRAPSTLRGYREELARLVNHRIPLKRQALARWVATGDAGQPLAPNTRNRRLVILRGFAAYLVHQKLLPEDPSAGIERARVPRDNKGALSTADLERLHETLMTKKPSWRRTRDEAIFLMLFQVGLRVSELHALNLDQVDLANGTLRSAVRKGGGSVDAQLNPTAVAMLSDWIAIRPSTSDSAVFVGGPTRARLGVRSIQKRLAELGRASGLRVPLHPHALRHAHATALYREGADIVVIGQSLNHASIQTTRRYIHTDEATLRAALATLPPLRTRPVNAEEEHVPGDLAYSWSELLGLSVGSVEPAQFHAVYIRGCEVPLLVDARALEKLAGRVRGRSHATSSPTRNEKTELQAQRRRNSRLGP